MKHLSLAILAWIAGGQLTAQPRPVTLVRCAPGSNLPCGLVRADLAASQVARLIKLDGASLTGGWQARFGRDTALPGLRSTAAAIGPARIMVLVDISRSMAGQSTETAQLALRQFLGSIGSSGSARVAVAPFGSVDVARRIGQARFEPPDSAGLALDRLPSPSTENRALYSAVTLGTFRVTDALRSAGEGARGLLIVVAGGGNDLRSGDDAGLLREPDGLAEAARTVEQSPIAVVMIGIGAVDQASLTNLAGPRGVTLDGPATAGPDALIESLNRTTGILRPRWNITVRLPASGRAALSGGPRRLELSLLGAGEVIPVGTALWKPPLVALPAFAGTAPAASSQPAPSRGASSWSWLIAVLLALLLVEIWIVLPRLIWAAPLAIPAAAPPTPTLTRSRMGMTGPLGLAPPIRTDLTEAPPRKPSDVTAARARRR
jgi:hypothetical protein